MKGTVFFQTPFFIIKLCELEAKKVDVHPKYIFWLAFATKE